MHERFDPSSPDWPFQSADHLSRYLFAVPYVAGKRVLDAATGMGYGAAIMASYGAAHVEAVDISAEAIEAAKGAYPGLPLTFLKDDCERLDSVSIAPEIIVSFETIEHLRSPEKFLARAAAIMAPGGVFLCSTPDKRVSGDPPGSAPSNPYHVQEWHVDEFVALLQKYFAKVEVYLQVRSHASLMRVHMARALHYWRFWSPLLYVLRVAKRIHARLTTTPQIWHLGQEDYRDYPVHPRAIAHLFGVPFVVVALCRDAIKTPDRSAS